MSIHRTHVEVETRIADDMTYEEVEIKVHYDFYQACKGATDGRHGPKIEPDEPAHIEITSIQDLNGNALEISRAQEQRIIGEIAEDLWEQQQAREPQERDE